MSIATKQLQQTFYNSNRLQQHRTSTFMHSQTNQRRGIKSIDSANKSKAKHVSKNVNKSRQLLRQTPVAVDETEEQPENKKCKSQSQKEKNFKQFENIYSEELENGAAKDYKIYQNGRVSEFFQNDILGKPKRISDICLVNDHYILVKMPSQEITPTRNNLAEAAVRRKEFRAVKDHNDQRLKDSTNNSKKLCRYLRSKRHHITKITPIHEEPEDLSEEENTTLKTQSKFDCLRMQSCWQANDQEVETYQTQTKISKSVSNSSLASVGMGQKIIKQVSLSSNHIAEKPQCSATQKSPDIQTISGSLFKSSLQYQVSLHSCGALVDSSNINNNNLETIKSAPPRKRPRFESFYWLLRPFRGRYRKNKPKIQAVVYKTYFVKWTKPPDTLSHGYGFKSSKTSEAHVSVLRRCRSAIF